MTGLAAKMGDERSDRRDEVLLRTRATCAEGSPHVITVVNLSPGGLMARSDALLASGDTLSVELPALGRTRVEIRWSLGGRIGCQFDQPIPSERYYSVLAAARAR